MKHYIEIQKVRETDVVIDDSLKTVQEAMQ